MTFGAGIMWVYAVLPIFGTFAIIGLQVSIFRRIRRIEEILENMRQNNA